MLTGEGKVRGDGDFIFYGQLHSTCGGVEHTGDNRTGLGDGDDEMLNIQLAKIPREIARLVVAVTIHEGRRGSKISAKVEDAFIRLVNLDTGTELARFDLTEDYSSQTALIFGELYRAGEDWKFKAVGQGYAGDLRALALYTAWMCSNQELHKKWCMYLIHLINGNNLNPRALIMAISLQKGGNVNLSKAPKFEETHRRPRLGSSRHRRRRLRPRRQRLLLKGDGKVRSDADFIFYNNLKSADGSITHLGDNTTGQGDGDDEQLSIDLALVPADVERVVVAVTIHDADARRQNFGQVSKAYIPC